MAEYAPPTPFSARLARLRPTHGHTHDAEQISGAESITSKVADTRGLKFEKIDWTAVNQLDRLDQRHAVVVRTGANNALNLEMLALP